MKISIRMKITLMFIFFTFFIVSASWIISKLVISKVFVNSVKENLVSTYESCNNLFVGKNVLETSSMDDGDLLGNVDNPTESIIVIYDSAEKKVYTSINDQSQMMRSIRGLLDTMYAENSGTLPGKYVIKKNHDTLINADYYDLIGELDNGMTVIIRSPIARINGTLSVVTKVFNNIVIGLIVFGSLFILGFSTIFSAPIKRLSKAAKKMTELNFDTKVPVVTRDEIGELSSYMNAMSFKLETTISELKSANIKLQKDLDDKRQIDDMRKEFLSHVSHELKTPLALIQGYAEGLNDLDGDEESREFYTGVIIDEAQKMNTLVKKLLDLNEIEFGNEPLKIERFELCEFVNEVLASSKILVDEAGANLVFDGHPPVYVWADEYMIEGVFTNLLTNAIHYVDKGGDIKIWFEDHEGDIRVNVYNKGNQIDDEDIDKLFIKFYKADKARTREYGGSGIGLSIVAATMEAHGKKYGVYNVPDGVVFYFDLDANMPC